MPRKLMNPRRRLEAAIKMLEGVIGDMEHAQRSTTVLGQMLTKLHLQGKYHDAKADLMCILEILKEDL